MLANAFLVRFYSTLPILNFLYRLIIGSYTDLISASSKTEKLNVVTLTMKRY